MPTKARALKTSLLQGFAVLGGVLLALAADAGWDYRTDRADELQYLRALRVDFRENRQRIADVEAFNERYDRGLRRLLTVIDSAGRSQLSEDSLQSLLRPLYYLTIYEPVLSTLDDLTQAGNLNLIRDDSLRYGLVDFRRALGVNDLNEEYAQNYWDSEMVALFRDDVVLRLLPSFADSLGPSSFSTDFGALVRDRRFENRVAIRWNLNFALISSGRDVSRAIEFVSGRLDALLDGGSE